MNPFSAWGDILFTKENYQKCLSPLVIALLCSLLFTCSNKSYAQPAGFTDNLFLGGWTNVVGFTFDANGRMFVWEKRGTVWIVENGEKSTNPLLDISDEVGNWRDFGLLGFALDPNFLTNGYYYLNYVVDRHHLLNFGTPSYNPNTNDYFDATIGRVTRYQADVNTNFTTTLAGSRQVLLGETKETGMPILHESHGVGSVVFGEDGTLLVCMGDGASYSSTDQGSASETYYAQALADGIITPEENIGAYRCQILDSHNGKLFRLDPMTGDGLPSNPFYDSNNPRSPQSRTWSLGVRNPYRMVRKPNTGSHDPADADPGAFYFGDVGWGIWEDLNVVSAPGQNFGWPKYEGITHMPGYNNPTYAPTTHERPKIDFRHGSNPSARGVIAGGSIVTVGSPQLPGSEFNGNASTGGVWYTGTDFPGMWQNTYFHADYSQGWIRNFVFDGNHNPLEVREFMNNTGPVVHLGTHPITGGLYYVSYPSEIRYVEYVGSGNLPPKARASANVNYGSSPLVVEFTGDQSYDPERGQLSYFWDFGDGNTSTASNPAHIFSNASLTTYNVTLTVTDNQSQTDQTSLQIFLNNTPPNIVSTSIDNTDTFNPNTGAVLSLTANVNDAEHTQGQLTFAWQTALYHNDHNHAEPIDNNPSTSSTLSPIGCTGATYWYEVMLTVSDPEGLSSTFKKQIFPNCSGNSQTISFNNIPDKNTTDLPFNLNASASSGLPVAFWVVEGPATISGSTVTLLGTPGTVTIRATQPGNGTFAPAEPVERSFQIAPVIAGGLGFSGTYFNNINLTNQVLQRTDASIDFDWGGGSPDPSIGANTFSIRWEADLSPSFSEQYTFYTTTDDGVRLWIDNQLIVDEWVDQGATTHSGTINLTAGQSVPLEMEYYENGGNAVAKLEWSSSSQPREIIPQDAVTSPGGTQEQTIAFGSLADKNTTDPPFSISATASSGLPVSFSIVTGPATVSGNQITLDGNPGIVIVRASQSGNGQYNAAPDVERAFTVNSGGLLNQTITFGPISDKFTTDPPFQINATASSGLPVSFSIVSGPATISGNTITLNGTSGTVLVRASQGGDAQYNPAPDVDQTFNVSVQGGSDIDLELSMSANPPDPTIWGNFTVTAKITNTSSNQATGIVLEFPKPAEVVFTGGNEFTVTQGSFNPFTNQEWNVGTLAPGANATLEMNFFLLSSDPFFIFGEVIATNETDTDSSPNNGSCCTANEDDEAAIPIPDIGPQNQTINFPIIPNKESDDPPFSISASATSGLPVTFAIISGPASISGNTITLTGTTGLVTVRASQAGNAQWNPAPDVDRVFNVADPGLEDQTIAFSNIPNKIITDPPFMLNATASSGLPVSFEIISGPATINNDILTLDGLPGSVMVRASQPGNAQYNPAPDVDRTFQVNNPPGQDDIDLELSMATSNQTPTPFSVFTITTTVTNNSSNDATNVEIQFVNPSNTVFTGGNEYTASQGTFNPFGSGIWSVGNIDAGASATLDANLFLLNANSATSYSEVTNASEDDSDSTPDNGSCCTANEDDEVALTVPQVGPQNQSINFPAIPDKESDDPPFQVSASATSGLPVSFSIDSGPATISGNTITLTGALGTVIVRASQGGNVDWNPAPDVTQSFNVNQPGLENQTITFDPIPNKITTDPPFQITASASSGLPVTFSLDSGPASIAGDIVTLDGNQGTVVIRASQAGDAQYNPAPDVTQSFSVSPPAGANDIDLEVTLNANKSDLDIWTNTTFTITITNNGNVGASGVVIDVPIPTGLAYTNALPDKGSYNIFFNTWNVGDLDVGESTNLDMVLFVLQNSTALDYYVQVSGANENDSDSTPGNGSCCTPNEDDEAVWTLQVPGQALYASEGIVFSFFAEPKGSLAKLMWVVNTGSHIDQFFIERSSNGYDYQRIMTRTNEEPNDYFMTYRDIDLLPNPGINYYRIVQELHDGSLAFSNVQYLEFPKDLEDFKIFPNPANNYVDVSLRPIIGKKVELKIVDRLGRELHSKFLESVPFQPYRIDLSEFQDGYYVVLILGEGRRAVVKKLIINRL